MILEPLGECAVLIALDARADRRAVERVLRALPGVTDAVLADATACVHFDPRCPPRLEADELAQAFARETDALACTPARTHTIRARYDGADLDDVARRASLTRDAVVALHAGREYTVAFQGFLPGFAYLTGLHPALCLPRRASPRPRVPAGAVAIAGERTAVYPFATPGGWHLLATAVDFRAFDPVHGAALALGDRVRFTAV